ncbi:hypothetical protein DFH11DRAFT_673274 [Phellopilus nigrolimitatus]|nr:hypothetical protein DFH11DRAFT_673274 [Phellopilus nigrolimitatus]
MSKAPQNPDHAALYAALQTHGQDFLSSFSSTPETTTQSKRKRRKIEREHELEKSVHKEGSDDEAGEDEWHGFALSSSSSSNGNSSGDDRFDEMDSDSGNEEVIDDDDFRSDYPPRKQPEVVVFSAVSNPARPQMSKVQAKLFMSSKVSKLKEDVAVTGDSKGVSDEDDTYEEERTNLQNDALLHKLVHTQLLSGSLNSDLDMTPAQRRKALEGRVLELAAGAKLGKGESSVRQEERKKASKNVRMGLERKVEEKKGKALEEAKNLGNYHHSIKHIFEASSDGQPDRRKRERGLKPGIGKFSGGILKLGRDDIAKIQEGESFGRKAGRATKRRK